MTIRYIPNINDRVKLRLWEQYTSLMQEEGFDIPNGLVIWAWLRVDDIVEDESSVNCWKVIVTHMDADKPRKTYTVPMAWINPPLGWKPIYDIYCKDIEQARNVIHDWFNRGITCWTSHDMSSMGSAFTPLEKETNTEQHPGHWKYTNNPIEIVPSLMCRQRFNVHILTTTEVKLPDKGKRERKKILDTLRSDPTNYVYHMFDFGNRIYYCEHTETIFTHEECGVCHGYWAT